MSEMMDVKKLFKAVFGETERIAFIRIMRNSPSVNLGDVAKLAAEYNLSHLTVGECFLDDLPKIDKEFESKIGKQQMLAASRKTSKPKPKKPKPKKRKKLRLSTEATKVRYDARVMKRLSDGDWWLAVAIRKAVGGNAWDTRQSLNRLYSAGSVQYKGSGRGMRYRMKPTKTKKKAKKPAAKS